MFADAIDALLRDHCTGRTIRAVEGGSDGTGLWSAIGDAGFLELLAPEADGGAGAPLSELHPVISRLGWHAAPVPVAQTIVARTWLPTGTIGPRDRVTLATQGLRLPAAPGRDRLVCANVPFGALADIVLAPAAGGLLLLDARRATRDRTGVNGSLAATLSWAPGEASLAIEADPDGLVAFDAAIHASLMAGAMARILAMTLQYCADRTQFGRPIGKFQVIQHQLAVMAEETAAAAIAAELGFCRGTAAPVLQNAAAAKARASEAASTVASIAHAVHGAIGVTADHDLQLFTRRLHEWRVQAGSEAWWHEALGRSLLDLPGVTALQFVRAMQPGT